MGDIQKALDLIRQKQPTVKKFVDYYDGRHSLTFATDKFKNAFGQILQSMRDNLCPIVVDATADRMEILNFSSDDSEKAIADAAWAIWQASGLELVSNSTHIEALKTGCAYVIVWPDEVNRPKVYLQDSLNTALVSDPDTGLSLYGAKLWKEPDGKLRLNLYYSDRIEKYGTPQKFDGGISDLKEQSFQEWTADANGSAKVENPYGVVPMFKFETKPILSDAIPLQDALNKSLCDKLVSMEFASFPQRWATGLELEEDDITGEKKTPFKAGIDRLWFTDSKEAKFGVFSAADLEQFLKVADSYRLEIARVTGTPLHFFSINTSDAISGEALKTLESRFTKRIRRCTLNFGAVWSNVMLLALQIDGKSGGASLTVQWQSPEQRSELDLLTALGLKRDTLEVPVDTLREEYGYSEEDIKKFNAGETIITEPDALQELNAE